MTGERYLPLFNNDGSWIERPDLYLLARMSVPDKRDQIEVDQIYMAMLGGNNSENSLNYFESGIERRHIRHDFRLRNFAATVVLEACRIEYSHSGAATMNKAVELVAFNHHKHTKMSQAEFVPREVWRGLNHYRNTSHLQAAWVYSCGRSGSFENDQQLTKEFLGLAKFFERFIERQLVSDRWHWAPWRVPEGFWPKKNIILPRLDAKERAICGVG